MRAEDRAARLRGLLELGELPPHRPRGRAAGDRLVEPSARMSTPDLPALVGKASDRSPQPSTSSSGCAAITSARFMTGPLPTT
jgi:hypothetical protein